MPLFHFIEHYWYYIPPVMIAWNILSRIIYAVATITPAICGLVTATYRLGYVVIVGFYLLVRKCYRLAKNQPSKQG